MNLSEEFAKCGMRTEVIIDHADSPIVQVYETAAAESCLQSAKAVELALFLRGAHAAKAVLEKQYMARSGDLKTTDVYQ